MFNSKYIIDNASNGEFFFVLKAGNGETILTSQMYNSKQSCLNGISSVKAHSPYDGYYHRHNSLNSKYYFNLHASNGQVIGTSQMYVSSASREVGIASVKLNGPNAPIEDRCKKVA